MAIPNQALSRLSRTMLSLFQIGSFAWKSISGGFAARNAADSADAEITASKVKVSGDQIVLNSDAAGSGDDWAVTLNRNPDDMTQELDFVLPGDYGSPGNSLKGDGAGGFYFEDAGTAASADKRDTTAITHSDSSPVTMFTLGATDTIERIDFYVDTAWNGTAPTASVGITGTTSKYMGTGDIDLKTVGVYSILPGQAAPGGSGDPLILTINHDSSSAGAGHIDVVYGTPS